MRNSGNYGMKLMQALGYTVVQDDDVCVRFRYKNEMYKIITFFADGSVSHMSGAIPADLMVAMVTFYRFCMGDRLEKEPVAIYPDGKDETPENLLYYECPVCGGTVSNEYNEIYDYCPNCGTPMKKY